MKTIGVMDIRAALSDHRFRDLFPELKQEIDKYLEGPKCGSCATPVVKEIINRFPERIKEYFPGCRIISFDEIKITTKNNFTVINCHIDELENKLRKLTPGRKNIAICRWEDQMTAVVEELIIS